MADERRCIPKYRQRPAGLEAVIARADGTRRQWRAWVAREPVLAGLDGDRLRRELASGDQCSNDALLSALAGLARTGPHSDAAFLVLARCLLPGLRRRIATRAPSMDRPEAFAVATVGLVERVHGYDPTQRPRFVATYLLETPADRLRRATAIELAWDGQHRHSADVSIGTGTGLNTLPARTIVGLAIEADVVSAADGWLIYATRAGGLTLADAARCLELSYAAAAKRRRRAERRWAAWWDPDHPGLGGTARGRP